MIRSVKTIGIVGGGQLARMLTLAAKPLGFSVVVVDPEKDSPASKVGATQITGGFFDKTALRKLADHADVITIEFEHIDARTLEGLARDGTPVYPDPINIQLIQDKLLQKNFFTEKGIAVAKFKEIKDETSALKLLKEFKKMIIKTRIGGFDGRGNFVVSSAADVKVAIERFKDRLIYAEKYVPFVKELAVMIARSTSGKIVIYPIVETKHLRNICIEVKAPAEISNKAHRQANLLAGKVAACLDSPGVYGIEMFLTKDDQVILNEVAPRVHNSGHYTIEGSLTSQFEQHIRAIAGLPLGSTSLTYPAAVMVNILGKRDGPTKVSGLKEALAIPGVSVHLYDKSPTRIDRKMGHITATGYTIKEATRRARKARKAIEV